ncbi:unnamed protein product [Rhodiola kirilowii]
MAAENRMIIALCHLGGVFQTAKNGSFIYKGGDTHAIDITSETSFDEFKKEILELFNFTTGHLISVKYILPKNSKILVKVSKEQDFKHMLSFHGDNFVIDVYVTMDDIVPIVSSIDPCSNSSRTTLSEVSPLADLVAGNVDNDINIHNVAQIGDSTIAPRELIDTDVNGQVEFDDDEAIDIMGDGDRDEEDEIIDIMGDGSEMNIDNDTENAAQASDSMFPQEQLDHNVNDCDEFDDLIDILGDMEDDEILGTVGDGSGKSVPIFRSCSKDAHYWQRAITGIGQRFKDARVFKDTLRRYAIAHQFSFHYKKSDGIRVTAKCKAEGCTWRIHASTICTSRVLCIRKMNSNHTCNGAATTTGYQATKSWVASVIKEKLKVSPKYTPKDIISDIKEEYGIKINYFQAYRGKEIAMEQLDRSFTDAYNQLPIFCEKILEANPGSYTACSFKSDSNFQGLFVSFRASLLGFQQGCRALLFLDSFELRTKKRETLISATAPDGDDKMFPVAFAIVDKETNENWNWVLTQLKNALDGASGPLTFVADWEKGLKESIPEIFPGSFHGYCLRYIIKQLLREVPISYEVKRLLSNELYNAACALTPDDFHLRLEKIKNISLEAYSWIEQSEFSQWANFLILGARYNHMDSNFGEAFFRCADQHEVPITQICEILRGKTFELFNTCRAETYHWTTRLTPSKEKQLLKESQHVGHAVVLRIDDNKYNVEDDHRQTVEVVDLESWNCSCLMWQFTLMPCRHALSVISYVGADAYDYCARYFSKENYRIIYADSLVSIPDMPPLDHSEDPPTRGTKRKGTKRADTIKKGEKRCSKCKCTGHNRQTCQK